MVARILLATCSHHVGLARKFSLRTDAPKYLSEAMSLGELTQSAAAFVVVQGAFNWVVDNYQRLADWRSSAHRVATLLLALDELEAKERTASPAAATS